MSKENLQIKVSNLTRSPGVYQFFDNSKKIIYVGKAKNLKKRVASYFRKNLGSQKTKNLVKNKRNILIYSNQDQFIKYIFELIEKKKLGNLISNNSLKIIKKKLTLKKVYSKYI